MYASCAMCLVHLNMFHCPDTVQEMESKNVVYAYE
jgi:hypothetical protein